MPSLQSLLLRDLPPLSAVLSDEWIAGTATSSLLREGSSTIMSAAAGELLGFGELVARARVGASEAVELLRDIGEGALDVLMSGQAWTIMGWVSTAIRGVYSGVARWVLESIAASERAALAAQWQIAGQLVLARTRQASELPGAGNYAQHAGKKTYPRAAFPPVAPRSQCVGEQGPCIWYEPILFTARSPDDLTFDVDCLLLGQKGACAAPPTSVIGLSLLTWPYLVERWNIPWGAGHLLPLVALLTTPSVLHVLVREADVRVIRERLRRVMRMYWRIQVGPPLREDAVTLWPDGAYTGPVRPEALMDARLPTRSGATEAESVLSGELFDLEAISGAFRCLARWEQCRVIVLKRFRELPSDVQSAALKGNPTDFNAETLGAA